MTDRANSIVCKTPHLNDHFLGIQSRMCKSNTLVVIFHRVSGITLLGLRLEGNAIHKGSRVSCSRNLFIQMGVATVV